MIAVAAAMRSIGRGLAPSPFEPIGPGTVPNGVAVIVIVLGGLRAWTSRMGLAGWRQDAGAIRRAMAPACRRFPPDFRIRRCTGEHDRSISMGDAFYFMAVVLMLSERPREAWRFAAPIAVTLAFGLDYIFRRILVADIP